MSLSHIITRKWASSNGTPITKSETVTGDGENNLDTDLPVGDADFLINFAFAYSTLKSFFMVCTKDAVVTPYDTGNSPLTSIPLTANIPFVWTTGSGLANPFSSNVGSLHVANAEVSATPTLSIRSLSDITPNVS